ncbi:MAG TPA: GNAT family N-acetyltransferase [Actinomycetaceae bacterium]|nr:GNAT family N-acetyltransferase [Actinomycetaceae bacterium]
MELEGRGVVVRERRPEDLPRLLTELIEQQRLTGYPQAAGEATVQFIARDHELAAFVAEVDGVPIGHVLVQSAADLRHDEEGVVLAAWERGHGLPASRLGVIGALFIGNRVRGRGVGTLLLDTATQWCLDHGLGPCLDIVPNRTNALAMYRARGWRTVAETETVWMVPGSPLVHVMVYGGGGGGAAPRESARRPAGTAC